VSGPLAGVAAALRADGGLLADAIVPDDELPAVDDGALSADVAFAMEAVREGWLLHSDGAARVVRTDDRDLALLAGDRLYALGVERLVALGDLASVALLADLIADAARTLAEGRPQDAEPIFAACADRLSQGHDIRQHARFTDR
jgi:hypothetical protein